MVSGKPEPAMSGKSRFVRALGEGETILGKTIHWTTTMTSEKTYNIDYVAR